MLYYQLENFFSNFSFFILLISMVYYWINLSFNFEKNNFGTFGMIAANLSIFILLVLRWKESGHFPLSNLYESFLFLSWNLTFIHFVLEKMDPFSDNFAKFLGAITSPIALFTNAFATFSLPEDMKSPSPLVPALQSNWLMMHVTVMILSYSALICGSLLSIAYLILTFSNKKESLNKTKDFSEVLIEKDGTLDNFVNSPILNSTKINIDTLSLSNNVYNQNLNNLNIAFTKKMEFADILDNLSYRILGVGFPLLTIGILSGAVWANEAWGSYWSWDPKETWALLTWFVFAIYLHTRLTKGWQGKKSAMIASLGFFIVWICFLGVNLLGEGLHSYGFIKLNG